MTRETVRQYAIALITSLIFFVILSFYIVLRRGYYDLYIANKVFAGVSFLLLGAILFIGSVSRLYTRFDTWVKYRKELGILAFGLAILHGIVSLYFLPDHFPSARYTTTNLPFLFGLSALSIVAVLFIFSFDRIISLFDKKTWWQLQYWGIRVAVFLVFLHVVIMKYPGWINWFTRGGGSELARPYLPPASFLVSLILFFVVVTRFGELFGLGIARKITVGSFIFVWSIAVGSLLWGITKTPVALPLDWKTCTKLPGSRIELTYPGICVARDGRRAIQSLESEEERSSRR